MEVEKDNLDNAMQIYIEERNEVRDRSWRDYKKRASVLMHRVLDLEELRERNCSARMIQDTTNIIEYLKYVQARYPYRERDREPDRDLLNRLLAEALGHPALFFALLASPESSMATTSPPSTSTKLSVRMDCMLSL